MPQFDTSQYPSLVFWMLVNCALLVGIFVGYYLPKFGKILSNRKAKLHDDDLKNNVLKSEVEAMEKEYLAKISSAQNEISQLISQNKIKAKERYWSQVAVLDEEFRNEMQAISASYQRRQKELEADLDTITEQAITIIKDKLTKAG